MLKIPKVPRSTMIKITIALAVILIIWLVLRWRSKCSCKKQKKTVTFGTMKPMELKMTAVPDPEVRFAEYDPEVEDIDSAVILQQEDQPEVIETFAEYVPEYKEKYVDAQDTYSHPHFQGTLL